MLGTDTSTPFFTADREIRAHRRYALSLHPPPVFTHVAYTDDNAAPGTDLHQVLPFTLAIGTPSWVIMGHSRCKLMQARESNGEGVQYSVQQRPSTLFCGCGGRVATLLARTTRLDAAVDCVYGPKGLKEPSPGHQSPARCHLRTTR